MNTEGQKRFLETLLDNLKVVLHSSIEAIRESHDKAGKLRSDSTAERTSVEIYDIEVFRSASAVTSAIDRLHQSIAYIDNYPGGINGCEALHTQYDWTQYHYSFFIAIFVSIPDLLLITINSIFKLGNPPRNCKRDIILNNIWIKETDIPKRLRDLESIVKHSCPKQKF